MAGFLSLLTYNQLLPKRRHENCHAVVDGDNLRANLYTGGWLGDYNEYANEVRRFFTCLRRSNVTPHVFFAVPIEGQTGTCPQTSDRLIERLNNLEQLSNGPLQGKANIPALVFSVFREILIEMKIDRIMVMSERSYFEEMVAYAKYLDAVIISGNARLCLADVPRGCLLLPPEEGVFKSGICEGPTFHFRELAERIKLDASKNPYMLHMWYVIQQKHSAANECFDRFRRRFYRYRSTLPEITVTPPMGWLISRPGHHGMRTSIDIMYWLHQHSVHEAEERICENLLPNERPAVLARLRAFQNAFDVPPENVVERLTNTEVISTFINMDLPAWFLTDYVVECKFKRSMAKVLSTRQAKFMLFLEDMSRSSVHNTVIRLRRVLYGILFGSHQTDNAGGDQQIIIYVLDRVENTFVRVPMTPLWSLWDPENPLQPLALPDLQRLETMSVTERKDWFLLTLTVRKSFDVSEKSGPENRTLFWIAVLKYWVSNGPRPSLRDVVNVLLSLLIVEKQYSRTCGLFGLPVFLRDSVDITPHLSRIDVIRPRMSRLHAFSQLEVLLEFSISLHRLLRQPLGESAEPPLTSLSPRAFSYIAGRSEDVAESASPQEVQQALDYLLAELFDDENRLAFNKTVELIWNNEDRSCAKEMVERDAPIPAAGEE